MPSEQHEVYIEKAVAKLRSEGWMCEREYRYDHHVFDIFAYNPKTKEVKVIEVQMSGEPKRGFDSLPFPLEYIFPEKPKTPREIESAARRMFSALSSPTRINIALAIEERPRYYIELTPFVTASHGLVAYHLHKLVRGGMVKRVGGKYETTDLGKSALSLLRTADVNGSLVQAQEWTRNTSAKTEHKPPKIRERRSAPKTNKLRELLLTNPAKTFTYIELGDKIGSNLPSAIALVSRLHLAHLVKKLVPPPSQNEEAPKKLQLRQLLLQNPPRTFDCKELAEQVDAPCSSVGATVYQMGLSHLMRDSTMDRTIAELQ